MANTSSVIPVEIIERRIFLIRGQKVMLSNDLAALYEVEPRALVQAVKRNRERFPDDFMFQLSEHEFDALKSQIVISSLYPTGSWPESWRHWRKNMISSSRSCLRPSGN